ncbi:lipopolysaccharide core heptose(II) kinase RfaY [Fusobacterium mortiferum]|jgi:tRNA A-37 threonylcarbamoyl transferase component Bud32|uniref:lipopolysaccharide core heptose(II) kinase RfaY n=1 Tax=Fusobacterium mortiferum TaxID=850 RepID=UPI000E438339|nr:lipopolysaccharide core heptose(II) kinase RfaY [Fusobacterium mortiferum]RGN01206.1 lipopolysaccharide biosynthesis protein [Fusobacterium mortiferum]
MKIKKYLYKEYKIYFPEEKLEREELGKSIIDNNFKTIKILKDTKRNYVAIIEIENKKYILKEFRSEVVIPQRKIQTFLKIGEALRTLINGLSAIEEGIDELVEPLLAIVKKKIFIEKSFLLMEYIDGDILRTKEDIDKVIEIIKKVHGLGRYHGDLNTSNFIKVNDSLKIIDTQMKKEKIWNFKKIYDIFTLKEDLLVKMLNYHIKNNYVIENKRISYMFVFIVKKIKRSNLIEKFREFKKKMRKKGWKI